MTKHKDAPKVGDCRSPLSFMRQRYRSLLRDEVSQTVEDPADVDDEIRYLCALLATGTR